MLLRQKSSGHMVEVVNFIDLIDLNRDEVIGRYQEGEEEQDPNKFKKVSDYEWEIQKSGDMRVPGRIFASEKLIREMDEMVWNQVSNVACLPGIQKASLAMPDAHWGY